MTKEPVDAVITWVDGNDKAHIDKLTHYLTKIGGARPEAAAPTRFNECGEINYCVLSLLRFAPWIRTIYIVTSAQTPPIIMQLKGTPYEQKVILVDERDLFQGVASYGLDQSYLPIFNSISIETLLWRIPGLANQFIYLNDDWSLIRPVAYEDFFRDDKLVFRGSWKVQSPKKWRNTWLKYIKEKLNINTKLDEHRVVQENSARLVGYHKYFFHLPHAPLPARKKTFEDFFLTHPEYLLQNIQFAFRDPQQFLPLSVAHHLEIKNKNCLFDNTLRAAYVNGACHPLDKIQYRLNHADKKTNVAFVCMQSLDLGTELTRQTVFNWLNRKIGLRHLTMRFK